MSDPVTDKIRNHRSAYWPKVLLIGEAPNQRGGPHGLEIVFMARVLGLKRPHTRQSYLHTYRRQLRTTGLKHVAKRLHPVNLLDEWPGRGSGGGAAFNMDLARERVPNMVALIKAHQCCWAILLGRRVQRAFEIEAEFFQRFIIADTPAAVAPHPSGVSTWWNSAKNRERALTFLNTVDAEVA